MKSPAIAGLFYFVPFISSEQMLLYCINQSGSPIKKPEQVRLFTTVVLKRDYMFSIMTWPKPEHDTWVAPSIRRAKS
jgi:hypothetical protein